MQHKHIAGRGKVSSSAHPQGTDINLRFNRERIRAGGEQYA
jgi:hypothetical protein